MLDVAYAAIGALALALGLASRPLRRLPLTETLAALILGVVLGPHVTGALVLDAVAADHLLEEAARIVLAISLMAVALRFPLGDLRRILRPVVILLTAVLGGMALVSGALAAVVLGLSVPVAAVLGTVLAPTDPVLASSVVEGQPAERDLPARLRAILSTESGANDGLAFGLVLLAVTVALDQSLGGAAVEVVVRFAIAVVVGGGLGWGAGRLLLVSEGHRDVEHSAFLVLTLSLSLTVLGVVELLGGQGVLAVYAAGLAYNHEIATGERREEWEVQEAINRYLVLPVFVLFGVALPWADWGALGAGGALFVAAVLVLRRLPLVLALGRPLRLGLAGATFAGWFGPIGVAALLYLAEAKRMGAADAGVWAAGTLVIAASTVVHGVTAAPGRRLFARVRSGA